VSPLPLVDRVDWILRHCAGKHVVHLGCTNSPYTEASLHAGTLLHARIGAVAEALVGVDADATGAAELDALGLGPVVVADLESLDSVDHDDLRTRPDVVVAGEVIEHLGNPGRMLRSVRRLLAPDGTLLVTTVNAYCAFRFAQYAVRGRGGHSEPVHPDHVAYYSAQTLSLAVSREGYAIDEIAFYGLGAEHRDTLRPSLRMIDRIATKLSPQLADGLVLSCRPAQ
jgi:SAM-dependent methyltransferase